jgi:hypothetical protein
MKQKKIRAVEIGIFPRLFLRFLLCYAATFAVGLMQTTAGGFLPTAGRPLLFVLLALLGGFLSVSSPFLLLLTVWKAAVEAHLFYRLLLLARGGEISLFCINACLFILLVMLFVYLIAAASACRFAHETYIRDLRLLFSKGCVVYLLRGVCLVAATLVLAQLLSHFVAGLPV